MNYKYNTLTKEFKVRTNQISGYSLVRRPEVFLYGTMEIYTMIWWKIHGKLTG